MEGKLDNVRWIIEKEGKNINSIDTVAPIPLHIACSNGSIEVVQYFYEHGSDKDINLKDNIGWNSLNPSNNKTKRCS